MENLNAEQIIKALEHCIKDTTCEQCPQSPFTCHIQEDALSLIKELTEKLENYRNELGEVRFALAEANNDKKKLTEENERLKGRNEHLADCLDMEDKYKDRLQGILLQFTDIVHKWGNKNGYDTSEISLVPVMYEENTIKSQIETDTVQKYKSAVIEYYSKPKYQPTKEHPIKHTQIDMLFSVLDQIAKEIGGQQ